MYRCLALAALLCAPHAALASTCETGLQRTVLETRITGRTVRFDIAHPSGAFVAGPRKREHTAWVRANTPWDARRVLENHNYIIRGVIEQMHADDPSRASFEQSLRNSERIASGAVGHFRAAGCIDQLAFSEFLEVVDLRQGPQEFLAHIYTRQGRTVMVADFDDKPDSPVGVNPSARLTAAGRQLAAEGWQLHAHLHNHPFFFGNGYGDIGAIAPSGPDVASYKAQQPQQAWITDGIEVVQIDRAQYQTLE